MSDAKRLHFTELAVARLKPPKTGATQHWDAPDPKGRLPFQLGLSLLVSAGGTKTYRSTFRLHDQNISRKLGRAGEITLAEARELTRADRAQAAKGIDPREAKRKDLTLFSEIVTEFVTHYCKPRQRTWDQTERILTRNCAAWLSKPIAAISKQDARTLLRGFIAEGHNYKARITLAWLKTLWRWAWKEDLVAMPLMDAVEVEIEKRERNRVYNDQEIKAIWQAADKLNPVEGAYIKLLVLLAPRKTALAYMRCADLDDLDNPTLWTTPFELTKSRKRITRKRVYLTPLPALAKRILKSLPKSEDRVFPTLAIHATKSGVRDYDATGLVRRLVARGAPADFIIHAARHTLATWLQDQGKSEWEVGLVLNHSGSSTITQGYQHGYPLKLKAELLNEWAAHVEKLVMPEGVTLLR
jgi:hypothetical protein